MPEDVARAARFLASPAAAFINGQVIAVNGGRADSLDGGSNDWST
jgi:NAD(P)-dependent dehydrogenase (short-subunit alcohol dehydrogenase family)